MRREGVIAILLTVSLAAGVSPAYGQARRARGRAINQRQGEAPEDLSQRRLGLVKATADYKASLEKLLPFEEANLKNAAETLEKRKQLYGDGIVSKRELDDSERAVSVAQAKLDETRKQMAEADNLVAEAAAAEQMMNLPRGGYRATAALIRYDGLTTWSLSEAPSVETFFASKFGRALPVSALGQTAVHDHLGFDHHEAMDVALRPDSPEGQALMAYLRSNGIPFIAFRYAVPGSATGAHIHIGRPSHRAAAPK